MEHLHSVAERYWGESRLSRLAREQFICFAEKGRREVQIPDVAALTGFVQRSVAGAALL